MYIDDGLESLSLSIADAERIVLYFHLILFKLQYNLESRYQFIELL